MADPTSGSSTTYRSPLLELPKAVPAPDDSPDSAVPWHFGDPFVEQRAAETGAVVVDRSHRQVIAVPGEERLSWLHLLISQHVTELPDGAGTEALILDSQGRVETHLVLAHLDGCVWMDTDPGSTVTGARQQANQPVLQYLEEMRFWSKVEPRDASDEYAVLSVVGPAVPTILEGVLGSTPAPLSDPNLTPVAALPGGGLVRVVGWRTGPTADLLVPRGELLDWWRRLVELGARPAGSWAYESLRVAALRPRAGLDTDGRSIPHELGWIGGAAHVAKGCYRGQETVSKVHNVGRPPRRLLLLHLDGTPELLPEPGDPVSSEGRSVGRVGTVVRHHELGTIALALVKRSVPVERELTAGIPEREVAAAVDPDSVPPEAGDPPGRIAAQRLRG
ncbi:folate-binding protein [Actinoalloteichus sp. AHMU CJ021]|uniref:Folate-binding protein YgfZ n=1 Tax=Actinoalloteichus caeruleus DSM 43889 TaxID=1120930 RepID=A0ABT1JL16_ACTCY|nr:folate-binding protein YgfZ [Actinoalloteichus caeruleus]AUS78982.1 folate-binding protein [Actinoalloteichus sp. AHMU CJ021]MCP2333205.1 hypothetical protein [Actinoalloteichus caeruleus DSM 43889]